jgi:phosphatidylglycerol---prolipoprotein diacylglyceryl transferase
MYFVHEISPILFSWGPLEIRWYGLAFALGIALNYAILTWIFKREKYLEKHLDALVVYLFVGLVVGARLGHVLFYEPGFYLSNPMEILKIWRGGLASHGAAIGLLIAYTAFCKRHKVSFKKYLNAIVVPMPLTAAFVRIGNFFNSEIVGKPTDGSVGVEFRKLDEFFPRHPAQLYEAALSLGVFVVLMYLYKTRYKKMAPMYLMFLYLLLYFGGRFVTEFWKDLHGPLPTGFPLSMGQLLSLVPVLIAVAWFALHKPAKGK